MTYQYICKACKNIQDQVHSINEDPEIKCEKCQEIMKKYVGGKPPTVLYKTDGFYKTDSAMDAFKPPAAVRENMRKRLFKD